MVDKNKLCPCGSGLEYSKCCGGIGADLEDISTGIEDIIEGYFETLFKNPKILSQAQSIAELWAEKLEPYIDREDIEHPILEYYGFILKNDEWKRYILKTLNDPPAESLIKIVETWLNPFILLGRILKKTEKEIIIEEVLGHDEFSFVMHDNHNVLVNQLVLGIGFQMTDNEGEKSFTSRELIFINDNNNIISDKIIDLAKNSKHKVNSEFLKEHLIDIYVILEEVKMQLRKEVFEVDLTAQQRKVLDILTFELEMLDCEDEVIAFSEYVTISYLLNDNPSFRKHEIIAAAVFKVLSDLDLLDSYSYSIEDVGEIFSISVSSISKHVPRIGELVINIIEKNGIE